MDGFLKDFGCMVFGDEVMRDYLPKDVYKSLRKTIENRTHLEAEVASVVANAMKDWACEKGATHFTHWFQPMTGATAEKHEAFISPVGNGRVIAEFSGNELIRGEPDASSFPSGGLRATFEARGYTAWDPTSYAFIKGNVLCIPTAFCSYSGEALDKKTPLLRSMQTISKQAERVLRAMGDPNPTGVITTVGAEQEYFLVDKSMLDNRPDLLYTGRTVLGARPAKGQDMDDHYFGVIKERVAAYMKELDEELWKLGILAKTRHNEVAPAQHELAPIFTTTNIAADQNQLTMEIMKMVAAKHGMVCLLHEKPFAGINGSGKHNNWAISTKAGENLLDPGDTPAKNARFLLFLSAVIKAVDEHQDLLRLSIASAGNAHRLGANEAPPAIVSIFIGDELQGILDAIKNKEDYSEVRPGDMEIGVDALPHFPKDSTDRNRTSPFAFTGNKFEFRMPGSALSISGPNVVLNTIIAQSLSDFADRLETAEDVTKTLDHLVRKTMREHSRIIFNGNGYSEEWVKEAGNRGLLNISSTVDAFGRFESEENIELFEKNGVFSRSEICSRTELFLETYYKTVHIEALTMTDMVRKGIIPALFSYSKEIAKLVNAKSAISGISTKLEEYTVGELSEYCDDILTGICELEEAVKAAEAIEGAKEAAAFYEEVVLDKMEKLRVPVDRAELIMPKNKWPYKSYGEILYSVR